MACPTLLPENVAAFGGGLEIEPGEIALFLALREVAHQRLFAHVAWLGPTLRGAVAEYAAGIGLDSGAMEEALRDIDMTNPANLQEALASGVLAPEDTPEQKAALARLETLLALVEGWVDHVVSQPSTTGCRPPASCRRRFVGVARSVDRRRRRSRPSWAWRCDHAGCVTLRPCGTSSSASAGLLVAMPSGRTRTCCPARPTSTIPPRFVSGSSISDDELAALTSGEFPTQAAPEDGEQAGPEDVSDVDGATAGDAADEDASDATEPGDTDESGKPDTAG